MISAHGNEEKFFPLSVLKNVPILLMHKCLKLKLISISIITI